MSHKGLIYFSSSDTEEEINEERVRATVPKNQGSYMDRLKSTSRGVLPGKKLKDDRLKTQQEKPVYHAHEQVRQEQLENASLPDKPVHRQEQSKTQPVHRQEQLENASLPDKPVHRQEEVSNVQEQVRQEQQLEEKSVHRQEDVLPALPKNDNVLHSQKQLDRKAAFKILMNIVSKHGKIELNELRREFEKAIKCDRFTMSMSAQIFGEKKASFRKIIESFAEFSITKTENGQIVKFDDDYLPTDDESDS